MATQTKASTSKSTDSDALPSRALGAVREAGNGLLDTAEQAGQQYADFQERLGALTGVGMISSAAGFQAGVTRDVVKAYAATGRKLIG